MGLEVGGMMSKEKGPGSCAPVFRLFCYAFQEASLSETTQLRRVIQTCKGS